MSRLTPYELILEPLERELFPAIRAEAEQRGVESRQRDRFVLLGHAGAAIREMMPDDAPADTIEEYGELLYQGYQFWSFGRRLYVLDESVTHELLAPRLDLPQWELAAPPACYVQLPYQRIWARVTPDAPFEPADGCFVVVDESVAQPEDAHLRILLVLGFRAERAGLSLVTYRADLEPGDAPARASDPWRDDAPAFANAIPGGERKGYSTLATTSELEALVLRVLYWLDRHPAALETVEGSGGTGQTRLPHVLVRASG